MKDEKLDMLAREIQDWYFTAAENCRLAGPFDIGGYAQAAEICESIIVKINRIYQTNYVLRGEKHKNQK